MRPVPLLLAAAACLALAACGPYRLRFRFYSRTPTGTVSERLHEHGPALSGWAPVYFVVRPMFPALGSWTGPVDLDGVRYCEVSHAIPFSYHFYGWYTSWLLPFTLYEPSRIEIRHAAPRPYRAPPPVVEPLVYSEWPAAAPDPDGRDVRHGNVRQGADAWGPAADPLLTPGGAAPGVTAPPPPPRSRAAPSSPAPPPRPASPPPNPPRHPLFPP